MTIGELEKQAGIKDRTAFWTRFIAILGAEERAGKLRSNSLEAGIRELRRLALLRSQEV